MARKMDGGKGSREAYWRGHVAACEVSGASSAQYCREHGLSYSGYQWWKRELKRRDGGVGTRPEGRAFAEVRLPSSALPSVGLGALIEISVAGSRRIHVHPGFDEETLVRVVAVLERAAC